MTKLKQTGGKVDISSWNFPEAELDLTRIIKAISKTIFWQFQETPPDLFISYLSDTPEIVLNIPIGPDENGVDYRTTLHALVTDFLGGITDYSGKVVGEDAKYPAEQLIAIFRRQIERLEKAIA